MAIDPDVETYVQGQLAPLRSALAALVAAFDTEHGGPSDLPIDPPVDPPTDPPTVADTWIPAPPDKDGYRVAVRAGRPVEAWAPTFTITLSQPSALTLLIGELHPPNFDNPRVVAINTGTTDFTAATRADLVDPFTVPADGTTIVLTVTSTGDPNAALYGITTVDAEIVSVVGSA